MRTVLARVPLRLLARFKAIVYCLTGRMASEDGFVNAIYSNLGNPNVCGYPDR